MLRRLILGFAFAGLALSAASPVSAQAEPIALQVFSGRAGLADHWRFFHWGGLSVKVDRAVRREESGVSIGVRLTEQAVPYAGFGFRTTAAHALPLDEELRKHGVVTLLLRNGERYDGSAGAPFDMKIALSFILESGEEYEGGFETLVHLVAAARPPGRDGGFTAIEISLAAEIAAIKGGRVPVRVSGVRLQYQEAPPCGFYLSDCTISRVAGL